MNETQAQGSQAAPLPGEGATQGMDPGAATTELARLLEGYLAELEAGRAPDRARFLAAHPHLAAQLEPALAGLDFIHQATARRKTEVPVQLGDFRILREVGRGGMGVVYEAEQVSLRRRVALKVLRFGAVADELAMRRFQREAETVARLHHTNIVPIFAVGLAEGVRYYAMQFIEGQDLADRIAAAREKGEPMGAREIADWGLQAAEALAHAHQRGVIHRDIKPSNLIRDEEGRIWLTDFGLARRTDDVALSVVGALLGTPRYMSPEQARAAAQPVDHRTDLYSLGATLYELATRRPLFEAATAQEVIAQILHAEPRAPRAVAPETPRDLETIILKCLAKEPADRYPTAQALAEDLRAFLAGRPLATRAPHLAERLGRWARRHRRAVTLSAVSGGVAVALVVGGWLGWQHRQRARLGQLALSTAGPNLLAEVVDAAGRGVTPVFPVPTAQPVSLPAGTYGLRVSAAGMLSETWPVDIQARQTQQQDLHLRPRWLWPPKEVNTAEFPETEIVSLGEAADLLVLTHATVSSGETRYERRLHRMRGATGDPAWEQALRFDASTLPAGGHLEEWKGLFSWGIASSFVRSGLDERAQDLDGDGTRDLVLLSRHSPSLVAVSGRDGTVQWWYREHARAPGRGSDPAVPVERRGRGAVVGRPAVADADGDGVADFIACFWSDGDVEGMPDGSQRQTRPQGWISAVSGRDGTGLWQRGVTAAWQQYANSSGDRDKYDALCRPVVVRVGGRGVVLLLEESRLLGWELATGEPAWPPIALGFAPAVAPLRADLDGDGHDEVLLLRHAEADQVTVDLCALTLPDGRVQWTRPLWRVLRGRVGELTLPERVMLPPADLDGDGRAEVVALTVEQVQPGTHVFGLESLAGTTGEPHWRVRLGLSRYFGTPEAVQKAVAGPDLDGDGHRELFLAWHGYEEAAARHGLYVSALSGRTGAALWRVHLPGADRVRALAWWQAGTEGWPLLLAGVDHGPGGQKMTYVLGGGSGRTEHVLPDVSEPEVADFNGDGIPDLYYTVSPQGAPRRLVVRGMPPEPWRRLDTWQAAQDLDGDGDTDLVGPSGRKLMARSGRDGGVLWETGFEVQDGEPLLLPAASAGDLDGDGVADLIVPVSGWRTTEDRVRTSYRTLAACSGKNGRSLWRAEGWEMGYSSGSSGRTGWSFSYPAAAWVEFGGGTGSGVLVVQETPQNGLRLTHLAGRDGRPVWELPVLRGGFGPVPSPAGPPVADFDGDGVADVALWTPEAGEGGERGPYRLRVFDGRTGRVLWSAPDITVADEWQLGWPEAVLGDLDGDGSPEVLVVRHRGYEGTRSGYTCELLAADGRTGQIRWAWTWATGFPDLWPPLVLSGGTGGARVCVAVREAGFDGLVVLDAQGQVRERRALRLTQNSLDAGRLVWRVVEGGAAGEMGLVYLDDLQVCLASGEALEVRWRWPVAGDVVRVLDPVPGGEGVPATLPVWTRRDVYGLDVSTGQPRWRGMVPGEPHRGGSRVPDVRILTSAGLGGWPRLQLIGMAPSVVSQVWPANAAGQYLAPAPERRLFPAVGDPAWPTRPWPWAERLGVTVVFLSGAAGLLLVGLPVGLAVWAVRRRSWWAGGLLLGYAMGSGWWFYQGVAACVVVGLSGWLLVEGWRRRRGWLVVWAPLAVAVALLPLWAAGAGHPLRELHAGGPWWWVRELVVEPLVIGAAGLPPLLFWAGMGAAWHRRDWRRLGGWAGAALLLGLLAGALLLWWDAPRRLPGETYAWRGWYGLGFAGVYAMGWFRLLQLGWQRAREGLRRCHSAAGRPAASA